MGTVTATAVAPHIWIDQEGLAWIDDTNVKVIEIIRDRRAYGSSADEMHVQYPHLSLAQLHAALAYYYDHQEAFDREIEQELVELDVLAAKANADSPLVKRLRAQKRLP
jgi:uncharacterized protein (DUF433 family)